jgi:hypothetical protein
MGFFSPAVRETLEINRTIKKAGSAQDVMFFLILTSWLLIYLKSLLGSTLLSVFLVNWACYSGCDMFIPGCLQAQLRRIGRDLVQASEGYFHNFLIEEFSLF